MIAVYFNRYKKHIWETFKLSLPIIFGRLGAVLMGVADNIMIGKVSYTSLAAAGIANAIFILVAIIPIGFLIVGSPMISSSHSRGDKEEGVNILKGCIQFSVLLSILFQIVLSVFIFNFHWFRQTSEVEQLAGPFFALITVSTLPLMIFIAIEQFSDGLAQPRISMFFNVTGLLLNIAINWVVIYGNFGFPALGLIGAGIGTLTARTYMAIGIWIVIKYQKQFRDYDLKMNLLKIHKESFVKIFKSGFPSGMQFFFEVSAFSLAAIFVGWLGTIPLAAHNVAISLASITYMLSTGFATGGSIRGGYAFGMKDRIGVLNAGKSSLILVTGLMTVSCLIFIFLNKELVMLFTNESMVIETASSLLIIAAIFQLADGIQVAAIRALLAVEDVNIPTLITLFAYWIVGLPVGCLLTFYFNLNVHGMWIGLSVGLGISAILMTGRFFKKAYQV